MKYLKYLSIISIMIFLACNKKEQKSKNITPPIEEIKPTESVKIKKENAPKLENLKVAVVPRSNSIMLGEDYQANIFVYSFDPSLNSEIVIHNATPLILQNGIGNYKTTPTSLGKKEISGVINIKKGANNDYEALNFTQSYEVLQPITSVYTNKMNVLYIGVDNYIQFKIDNVSSKSIQAKINNGTLTKGQVSNEYIAKVNKPGETTVTLYLKTANDSLIPISKENFRIKRVPNPVAKIGRSSGGNMKTNTFKAQRGIMAVLENFDFEFKYSISSFEMLYVAKRQDYILEKAKGPLFSQKMLGLMKRAKPGDIFIIDNIKAKGQDGTSRKLPSLSFILF